MTVTRNKAPRTGSVIKPPTEGGIVRATERGFTEEPVEGGVLRVYSPRFSVFVPDDCPETLSSADLLEELLGVDDPDPVLVEFLSDEDRAILEGGE